MKQIQIIGNIGRDAQVFEGNGREFVGFSVAVNDKRTDEHGNPVERTDWFSVSTKPSGLTAWLTKGTQVFIQGELSLKTFRRDDGNVQVDARISASKIRLLGGPDRPTAADGQPTRDQSVNSNESPPTGAGEDDDLPF